MGVYIPGMEMPTSCLDCQFGVDGMCVAMNPVRTRGWRAEETTNYCPLVPVPPHGRLIDADAFSAKIIEIVERQKYDDFYAQSFSVGEILREVADELMGVGLDGFANAPTIIPADPAEETPE